MYSSPVNIYNLNMMDQLIQFEKDLEAYLHRTYAASSEQDPIKRLHETELTVFGFVDNYLLETTLIARDIEPSIQRVLDEFAKSKADHP